MRAPKRSDCPIARGLELVGDRWSLVILRDLALRGKRRYGEMMESAEGISSSTLASRLAELERHGLITRAPDPANGKQILYAPTRKGLDLVPVLVELARWTLKYDPSARKPAPLTKLLRASPSK
jgi:DNA-binding HxlR family transcriptional regulator